MFARKDSPSPTLSERSAKDGRHCDLCGSPSPAVRCDKCGGHCFCLSCDDMYHRHPKRKSHQRKAADSVVPGSGPGTTRRPATAPGDPSKMPIPPPRKKKGKSIFSFSSSGNEVPALPKKEFSLTEKLGSIRRFMSNRPLPPIPKDEDIAITGSKRSPSPRMPAAISAQQALERQGHLPKSRTPSEDGFPHQRPTSPQYQNILSHLTKLAQSSCEEWEEDPSTSGSARGSSGGEDGWGQDTRTSRRLANPPPLHPRGRNPMEDPKWTGTGTLRRGQVPFLQHPGGLAAPGMHLSSSATDLTNLEPGQVLPQGGAIPGYPYMYPPGVPPLFPHFAPAQSMGRLNYPYYGGSWTNIRNKGTDADGEDDGEDEAEADSKRSTLTRRRHSESKMKRSQSVMYDPNLVPGAYFPFGAMPPGYPGFVPPAPGFPYWGHPDGNPGPEVPSPSSSQRSLTRPHGRSRRRQPDDDSSSSYAGGSGAPRNPAGHGRSRRRQDNSEDLSSEEEAVDKNPKSNSNPKSNPGSKSKSSSGISTPRGEDKYDARNEPNPGLNHGSNPGSNPHPNPSSNPGHNPGPNHGSNSKDNPGHNPGPNHGSNSKDNPGHNPDNSLTPTPSSVPTSTWECEFCTFINAPGSRICSICCKSISIGHHDTEAAAAEPMEAKKDINMTEISDEVIKEQERIEKEIRRQIEVQQKLRDESPGAQESQISSVSSTEKNEVQATESKPTSSSSPPPPCSSPAPALASAPAPAPATERLSPKVDVEQQEPAASNQPSSGVEIETQTETSDSTFQTEPVKENKPEPRPADVSTQSEDVTVPEEKPQPEFPKILSPSRYDSSCQTNGDLVEFQKDLSVRPKTVQTVSHQTEDISRISETLVERGDQVEMGTSPPPQDFFTQPTAEDVEPQRGREAYGFLHRSLSQTSLNADRDQRRKERFDDGFAPLVRSLSRGSLASEPGTGGYSGGQSSRHSRGYQQSAFAPVGSGPRSLYTSDWNLHRRTDWDEDGNRQTRLGTSGSWQAPNLERRKSEYFLEELAERRRQEKMRSQGLEMVRMVRKAEQAGFAPDDLQVALANCGDQDPVDWLEENWRNMIETVATLATNYGHDKPDNDVGLISAGEARSALRIHRGNIWSAVTECVETRQRKYLDIQKKGNYTRQEIIAALTAHQGDTELAFELLLQNKHLSEKPWQPPATTTEQNERLFEQIRNTSFTDARFKEQPVNYRQNTRSELRRSSLTDNFPPPNRNESRRFSYSAGIAQPSLSTQREFLLLPQRAVDVSDAQSHTSDEMEDLGSVDEPPQAQDQKGKRDRLSSIISKRGAQKEVKRSSSFLDKLASLRKDKKQERKPNESRFLRYGSLNVLDVDTSGLRQSSFEEAMSSEFDNPTEAQPQKKGFFSRLLTRSSETDLRHPKMEFPTVRDGHPQMFDYPVGRMTQEYPVMMDQSAMNQMLAETSAIEKVQAYLNQIPGNNDTVPTSISETTLQPYADPFADVRRSPTFGVPFTPIVTTQSGFTPVSQEVATFQSPHNFPVFAPQPPASTEFPQINVTVAQEVAPLPQNIFTDANQLGEMLQKLSLLTQMVPAAVVPTQTAPGDVAAAQGTIQGLPSPPVFQADIPHPQQQFMAVSPAGSPHSSPTALLEQSTTLLEQIELRRSPVPIENTVPTSSAYEFQDEGARDQEIRPKVNNNNLKAMWLGVDLDAPIETENITKQTETLTTPISNDNFHRPLPTAETEDAEAALTTEQLPTTISEPTAGDYLRQARMVRQDQVLGSVNNFEPAPTAQTLTHEQPLIISRSYLEIDKPGVDARTPSPVVDSDLESTDYLYQKHSESEDFSDISETKLQQVAPAFDEPYKEIREFFVGPAVIKKGTSLELEPEDEDEYLEGTLQTDSADNRNVQPNIRDVEPKDTLALPLAVPDDMSSSVSDSIIDTESTDLDSTELTIESYVQSIFSDNTAPRIPRLKSEARGGEEPKKVVPEHAVAEAVPPVVVEQVNALPVEAPHPEIVVHPGTEPAMDIADKEALNVPVSPVRRRKRSMSRDRTNKPVSPMRVDVPRPESNIAQKRAISPKPAEPAKPIVNNKVVETPDKTIPTKSPEVQKPVRIGTSAAKSPDVQKLDKIKVSDTTKTVAISKLSESIEPESPRPLSDTLILPTLTGTTRIRRQRSVSRDRRPTLTKTESMESSSKDTSIRRRGSTKTGEPVETGRKSLRDSKKAGESRLDRYKKSARSPEKQNKAEVQSQNGAVMSAKRLALDNRVKDLLAKDKCTSYEQAEMAARLMEMNFGETEAIEAAKECGSLYQAISFLQQDCELCAGKFPVAEMVSMIHCTHRACRECLKAYFSIQIRDRNIMELLCPFCSEPDLTDDDKAADYFNHMDLMLKNLVEQEIHELFHRKLRDRALMKDPNFRWCSQCSSGFIINNPNQKRLLCPDCKAVTCASCRKIWEKQHEAISCQQFQEWKEANDPELQAAGLAQHLAENGIDCPNCKFRYSLAKGGCMHFRCIQCQYDFCSGCSKPFKMGQKCGVSDFCAKLGLHAHHPRNCLFYLRDKEPTELQKLLDEFEVPYNKEPPTGSDVQVNCQVMEQKETPAGLLDDICGKDISEGYAGLCRIHYTEFLVELINRYRLDPLPILDVQDLQCVLRRGLRDVPQNETEEAEETYRMRLVEVIQAEMPLEKIEGC